MRKFGNSEFSTKPTNLYNFENHYSTGGACLNHYSNDEWTLVDTLGYEPFIQQLLRLIEKAQPPFSIGIYGGWGTGKTSIMRQLF